MPNLCFLPSHGVIFIIIIASRAHQIANQVVTTETQANNHQKGQQSIHLLCDVSCVVSCDVLVLCGLYYIYLIIELLYSAVI